MSVGLIGMRLLPCMLIMKPKEWSPPKNSLKNGNGVVLEVVVSEGSLPGLAVSGW